ncbi:MULTISPECIES: DUF3102 domain-containing protein [Pseudomonas]|jgi:hypothetical protein|uniref:DUF3102 domain-containing protein n=1 Tax=Pseudomonas TaxID=286 RepID=UPI0006D43FC1|nr:MULTISPECIES: DUF3102 domain-containing protein [Pseudomonas]MBA1271624.1 DUF3102 domain-containing protein [Pseudomonas carnis]MBV2081472.1 DUF3102 domain-containing protein [Pseudomonas carnis]MBV2087541.1 DUF3102 domain-containing protein [Pseudomonas carnis]MCP9731846.1 DUF3102 domain-containing protein [Pseudomonas sp. GBPI_506]MDO3691283.1 DUF3102 domain-containing protein [Pseudomonas sp. DKN 2791]
MARIKTPTPEAVELAELNGEVLTAKQNLMASNSAEVMTQYGDGLPYDRTRLVNEARFYMAQSAEAMLEAGKRLIVLKENEPHGEFEQIVREQLGIPERTARQMMQATLKYSNPQLESKRQALAVLGKTKLFELMTEDDEDLASLTEGGTVAGLALEDIDRMTSRELRAALREAREDANAKDERLADRNQDLEKVTQELIKTRKRIQFADPDEVIKDLRVEVIALTDELELTVLGKLREGFNKMAEHGAEHGQDHRFYQADLIRQLELALATLRSDFHLPEHQENQDPVWMDKREA